MDIKELIPQREPFLFIDKILDFNQKSIQTSYTFNPGLDFFKGHFPEAPIVPGVILNEHCFQSGAALISTLKKNTYKNKLAVVTRIQNAKFKNMVKPGDTIISNTTLIEQITNAVFFRSIVTNQENKKVLTIEFSVATTEH